MSLEWTQRTKYVNLLKRYYQLYKGTNLFMSNLLSVHDTTYLQTRVSVIVSHVARSK